MTTTPSFTSLPIFCTTGNKVVYDSTIQNIGYQPQQQLPCEYYNYLENGETINLNTVQSGLTNIIAELTTLLTAASITASGNTVTNQTKAALDVLYQAHANGANWQSALAEVLGQGHVPSSSAALAIQSSWNATLAGAGPNAALGANWPLALSDPIGAGTIWTSGNDGFGSGLDADLVNGLSLSSGSAGTFAQVGIAANGHWVPPEGLYMMTSSSPIALDVWNPSSSPPSFFSGSAGEVAGLFLFDGVNYRLTNTNSSSTFYVAYRKLL